jgi:hypothetical protein
MKPYSFVKPNPLSRLKAMVSRGDGNLLVIFTLPLVLLCVNQDWIFSNQGLVDPWIYFGYFLNLPQYLQTFAGTYYSSRLPFILPGYLVYQLFPPLIANYILHLGFYYAAVISLYLILKGTVSRRAALFAAIFMGYYPYFLGAVGWDYVDGAGIAYFLLTLLMLTRAAKSPYWKAWLCLSGIFYGALIYTNLFLISFTPAFVIYYFFANREERKHPIHTSFAFCIIGLILITALLATVNYVITGDFLFFLPSIQFASAYSKVFNPYKYEVGTFAWIDYAPWLPLPSFTFLISLLFLIISRVSRLVTPNRFVIFFQFYFIFNSLIMVFWELRGQLVLHDYYYPSYLIPSMFLAIGTQFNFILNQLKPYQFIVLLGSLTLIFLLPLACSYDSFLVIYSLLSKIGLKVLLLSGFITIILVFTLSKQAAPKSLTLLAVYMSFNLLAADTKVLSPQKVFNREFLLITAPYNKTDSFVALTKGVKAIRDFDPEAKVRFWYDANSSFGAIHHSIASAYLYWTYRWVNNQFPVLQDEVQLDPVSKNAIRLDPNVAIAILSNEKDVFQRATKSLIQMGLNARILSEETIKAGDVAFTITFIKTEAKGNIATEPTYVTKDFSSPWSKHSVSVRNLVVDKKNNSIIIGTNKSFSDRQLSSPPIKVERDAKYLVKLNLKIEAEGAAVYVVGADRKTLLANRSWCKFQTANFSQREFIFDTASNEEVFIEIANYSSCITRSPKVSKFQLKDLEIRRIQTR